MVAGPTPSPLRDSPWARPDVGTTWGGAGGGGKTSLLANYLFHHYK